LKWENLVLVGEYCKYDDEYVGLRNREKTMGLQEGEGDGLQWDGTNT
jgi:hypothetical protein